MKNGRLRKKNGPDSDLNQARSISVIIVIAKRQRLCALRARQSALSRVRRRDVDVRQFPTYVRGASPAAQDRP